MSELPKGWQSLPLGSLGKWSGGGTPSKAREEYWSEGTVPWLSPKDMKSFVLASTQDRISELAVLESTAKRVAANSIAVVMRSGILEHSVPVALVPFETTLNQDMKALTCAEAVVAKYAAYALLASEHEILRRCRKAGTTVASLNSEALLHFEIPVPPLDEQQRIVEILDDHFSRLDAASASLRQQVSRLERLRVAAMHSVFSPAEPMRTTALESLLCLSIGGVWGEEAGVADRDVRVIRVTELRRHGHLDPTTAARRSVSESQYRSRALQSEDLLLEKSGGGPTSPVGRVGIVERLEGATVCANFMQLMRPDQRQIEPRYLHLYLNYFHASGGTIDFQTATTNIRNIKTKEYMQIQVPCPDLEQQEADLIKLQSALTEVSRLESAVVVALRQSESLRRSLLHAAFTGVLTKEFRNG